MKNDTSIKSTLIDYAILGLIYKQPKSGYGIRKVFEETALGNYSSSPGTIYPALNRLRKFELVVKIKVATSNKFHIKITHKGLKALKTWLSQPLDKVVVEKRIDELILRFAFMDSLIGLNQKVAFLTSFRNLLSSYINELKAYHKMEFNNFPLHGRLAFEYGIESYLATLKWCKNALLEITKKQLI